MDEAVRRGDLERVREFIRRGVDVSEFTWGGDTLLQLAIKGGYKNIALALLEAGADVHAKDVIGRTALHWACFEGSRGQGVKEVVQVLINKGSKVDERDKYGYTPLMVQWEVNETSMCLLRAGASCEGLHQIRVDELFSHACHEGDVFVVHTLLKNGCQVNILSREEQEELLHHACREGDVFLVEALLDSGCNINCVDSDGLTPLMVATSHEKVVKKLILAGANLGMRTASGNTALHRAATHNNIQCGILLVEGGASVRTKNKLSQTPLHLASTEFQKAIKEALSFTTRKALCIIGNAESGKSTLIATLQAESNSFFGKIINRFRRVDDLRQRTAGIETVSHCSRRYGEVLFFDFAGQDDYHGPHQMFLESLLSKPGVSMTLLLVVKMTEEKEAIFHQLHRWLSPVAVMGTTSSPPNVIIIGF